LIWPDHPILQQESSPSAWKRASPGTRGLLAGPLKELPDAALRSVDPTKYADQLDVVCRAVGEHLVSHFGPGRSAP